MMRAIICPENGTRAGGGDDCYTIQPSTGEEPEQEEKNRNGTRKANVCCDGKANLIDFPIRHPPKNGDRPDGWDQWINTEWGTSSSAQG